MYYLKNEQECFIRFKATSAQREWLYRPNKTRPASFLNAGFKIAGGCRLQPAFSGHLPAIFKRERRCFFAFHVIDSEQETIYSVEDDPFDCGMRRSSEAESD